MKLIYHERVIRLILYFGLRQQFFMLDNMCFGSVLPVFYVYFFFLFFFFFGDSVLCFLRSSFLIFTTGKRQ